MGLNWKLLIAIQNGSNGPKPYAVYQNPDYWRTLSSDWLHYAEVISHQWGRLYSWRESTKNAKFKRVRSGVNSNELTPDLAKKLQLLHLIRRS